MTDRSSLIKQALLEAFNPVSLDLVDDSASHAGHAGATQSGGGHFYATIVSDVFEGKSPVQRHQLVYRALGNLMRTDIHAISIKALTSTELNQKETLE
jgi:BolA protein